MFAMLGKGRIISDKTITVGGRNGGPDLLLLFKPGERPSRGVLLETIASLPSISVVGVDEAREAFAAEASNLAGRRSADIVQLPGSEGQADQNAGMVELQMDGLTFDCTGFPPGEAEPLPPLETGVGLQLSEQAFGVGGIGIGLSPHVMAGAGSLPILRGHLELAAKIAQASESVAALCWSPARLGAGVQAFSGGVAAWLSGGVVPVQLLVSFRSVMGAGVQSRGLAYFTGQELRMERELAEDPSLATQLGQRIATQLIHQGKLEEPQQITAPDGRPLRLEPSRNGRFVRAWLG